MFIYFLLFFSVPQSQKQFPYDQLRDTTAPQNVGKRMVLVWWKTKQKKVLSFPVRINISWGAYGMKNSISNVYSQTAGIFNMFKINLLLKVKARKNCLEWTENISKQLALLFVLKQTSYSTLVGWKGAARWLKKKTKQCLEIFWIFWFRQQTSPDMRYIQSAVQSK